MTVQQRDNMSNTTTAVTTERERILAEYSHENGRITSPGKFEGEPVFAPYFWDLGLQGFADRDDGSVYTFRFSFATTDADLLADWPELGVWLGRKRTLNLCENDQGFVHCF